MAAAGSWAIAAEQRSPSSSSTSAHEAASTCMSSGNRGKEDNATSLPLGTPRGEEVVHSATLQLLKEKTGGTSCTS